MSSDVQMCDCHTEYNLGEVKTYLCPAHKVTNEQAEINRLKQDLAKCREENDRLKHFQLKFQVFLGGRGLWDEFWKEATKAEGVQ